MLNIIQEKFNTTFLWIIKSLIKKNERFNLILIFKNNGK
ncbi:hypothetical protein EV02_0794 [Prochlorococcus marinus str. SB]|uniref:Uncharacterized protein n=1 Tax=Prochlorococcus marinus str. SB TaxID=59926 RepID=A0A0A2B2R3_PROMR|nr:hypothetical protein EV02_0794 [Prochlorococcus marinus str. SB]